MMVARRPLRSTSTSASISRGDLAAKTIAVNALVANYLKGPAISGTIKADTVTSGTTVISGIGVDLKRDGEWTNFTGGATIAGIPATAAGRVKIADGTTSVEIASGEATVRGIKAAMAQPSSLSVANGAASIEKLVLDVGGGSATVSGTAGRRSTSLPNFRHFRPPLPMISRLASTRRARWPERRK